MPLDAKSPSSTRGATCSTLGLGQFIDIDIDIDSRVTSESTAIACPGASLPRSAYAASSRAGTLP